MNVIRHFKIYSMTKKYRKNSKLDTISEKVASKYNYIFATFAYKEPLEIIKKCLENISNLNESKSLIVAVCLEERTPDLERKIKSIEQFESTFSQLLVTVHPYGVEGEIPGKCSNSNYAIRSIYKHLKSNQEQNFKPEDFMLVNFDIDTIFHKNFLQVLKETVENEKQPDRVVWQPLLYYNWNMDKLSFFTRIIGILRSTMMAGALITFNLNVMSAFCASLKLYVDGNFVHPFYQMDDIICYIRWMIVSKKSLKIKPIYSPTISGPTSGENWIEELKELFIQGKRWTIGSAEVFHYFMCKLRRIKFKNSLVWGINYLNYYCVILCIQTMFSICTTVRVIVLEDSNNLITKMFLIFPGLMYILNFFMIIVNKHAVKSFLEDLDIKENLGFFREILHFILSVPTIIVYSFITLYGFLSILIHGKDVCKHRPSNKSNLV